MKPVVLLLMLVCAGCASTTYGYLYEPKDGVDASQREAVAAKCRQSAKIEPPERCTNTGWVVSALFGVNNCAGAAIMRGHDLSYTNTETMDACMEQAGFVRTQKPR